jgi:competence protein ComEC
MLVDAGGPVGGPFANASPFDIGEEVVSPYLWSRGVRRLEIIALTHAHSDHMGGMPAVLRNFRPRELWVGNNPHTASYDALLNEAAVLGIRVRSFHAGETVEFGPAHIQMLAPQAGYRPGPKPVNNDSLVMEIHYGRGSALLEGDAEAPSERAMLAAGLVQPATLLKAGHHGSRTSSTPEFLAAAAPEDAVISAGRRNHFGHPRPEVVQQFAAAHVKLARTDLTGATTFLLKPDGSIEMRSYASNP